MGGQVCKASKQTIQDPLALVYGKDQKQTGAIHLKDITFNNKQSKDLKQIMKILDQYSKNLRQDRTLYKDPNMSTQPVILKSKTNQIRCTYERPNKFLDYVTNGQPYKIIDMHDSQPSSIEVKDQIMQYFGVFLCFLSNKPILIQKIISTSQNTFGIHCIQAYREGRIVHFFIDDYILCRQKGMGRAQPVFSQPVKNMYIWPCLLEKAWFKIKGNSAKRVQQNCPEQVFQTFLSIPIQKIYINEGFNFSGRQKINKIFSNYDVNFSKDKGYICRSKKNPEHDIGVSGSRYFYILDTFIDNGKRMFYIRNPAGFIHYRGIHDQISPKLLQILQKKYVQISPGNFLMDEQQFIQQMAQILIVNYLPGNKITPFRVQMQNEQEFFIGFDLKYKGLFNLCLVQNHVLQPKVKNYYPIMYHVVRLNDQKLIGGLQNKQGCFGVKNTYLLDRFNEDSVSSKYMIRLKKKLYQQIPNIQLYLIGYYMESIKFQLPTQFQLAQKWKQFLKSQGAKQLALAEKGRTQRPTQIDHVVCWLGDIVFVFIQKKSKKNQISIQVNFPELMNLQCISHPQIKRSNQWKSYTFTDNFLIIFQKIVLTAQTHIRQYYIEPF